MGKNDIDPGLFEGVEVGGKPICKFRGWVKDCQISANGDVTLKFGVYGPDKWESLKVTDIREQVISVDVSHLRPVKKGDRSHLDRLRESMAPTTFENVINDGDVVDLVTVDMRTWPRLLTMSPNRG